MESVKNGIDAVKGVQIANEIVAYGGLMWGNVQTLKTIRQINEDEDEGTITHSAARSARAAAVLGAIQGHILMFAGPLHEQLTGGPREEPIQTPRGGKEE